MNFDFMTSIFLFHDKNTSINDKSIISEKVYFCNVNFTRHPRRQIHQSLPKNRLNLSLIYDAEHSVILTELQSALRLSPISPSFPHIDAIADQWKISQTILHGRDAILRVRDKWLIFNMVAQLWADVKYHVPTGFGFSPKASGIYPLNRYSIDVNSEDERRWGHKKALGLGSQGLRLMIVIESVYFITFAEEVVPSV